MKNTKFKHNNENLPMQNIPMHITGGVNEVNILDNHILIEDEIFTHVEFEKNDNISNINKDYILLYHKTIEKLSASII